MALTNRQEGIAGLAIAMSLLVLLLVITYMSTIDYIPSIFAIAGITLLATVCGAIIPQSLNKILHPGFEIEDPRIERVENHDMGADPILIRVPVTAKRGDINEAYAEVISIRLRSNSKYNKSNYTVDDFSLRGNQELFWADHYEPHSDIEHSEFDTSKKVLKHMVDEHLSDAGPINHIAAGSTEYINIIMKVEGLPESFIADSIGSTGGKYSDATEFYSEYDPEQDDDNEFTVGEFEYEIRIGGDNVRNKTTTIVFRTGPSILDLNIPE